MKNLDLTDLKAAIVMILIVGIILVSVIPFTPAGNKIVVKRNCGYILGNTIYGNLRIVGKLEEPADSITLFFNEEEVVTSSGNEIIYSFNTSEFSSSELNVTLKACINDKENVEISRIYEILSLKQSCIRAGFMVIGILAIIALFLKGFHFV